jgi:PAS domain S-box-containing protein
MNAPMLTEYRCLCGKLLLKGIFFDGALEIKCKHCGQFNNFGTVKQLDNANRYSLMVNDLGMIIDVSDSACRILGYSVPELIGKSFFLVNPKLPRGILREFFKQKSISTSSNHFQLNTYHLSKSGQKIPVSVYLKPCQSGNKENHFLVVAKIKVSPTSPKNIKKIPPSLVDICDFYFDIGKDGTEQFISPAAENIFGYSSEEILGNNYFDYLPIANIVKIKQTLAHFAANGLPFRILRDISKNANGKTISNDLYFTPTTDNYGNVIGYRVFGWTVKPDQTKKTLDKQFSS